MKQYWICPNCGRTADWKPETKFVVCAFCKILDEKLNMQKFIPMELVQEAETKADGLGLRFSEGKPRYDLLPPEAITALAQLYLVGSRKYAERNWERGMPWSQCWRPLLSHSFAWLAGETHDKETGCHHMIHVAWNAIALYTYFVRQIGTNDLKGPPTCQPLWNDTTLSTNTGNSSPASSATKPTPTAEPEAQLSKPSPKQPSATS